MREAVEMQWIDIGPAGGQQGLLALPPARKGPGLVLFQEIFGVNAHIQGVVRQYALDGFVVLAPDLFWRQSPKVQLGYEGADRDQGVALMKQLVPAELEADIAAAADTLRARPETGGQPLGSIGYCIGGRLSYLAAALNKVDAAVAYYGGGIQDQVARAPSIACPVQFHYAENDAAIPQEAVDKVRVAMADKGEFHLYAGATHGFNCWDRANYDPASAALAHGRTLQFLARHLFKAG